jgi:hypothetical protein
MADYLAALHASLDKRLMPEQVARIILDGCPDLSGRARDLLLTPARARAAWWASSMPEDYARPVDASRQVASAARMFGLDGPLPEADDVAAIREFIDRLGLGVGGWRHDHDWKADRIPKEGRREIAAALARSHASRVGLDSKRQYNRRVRVLRHLAEKAAALEGEQVKRRLILAGHSGFAQDIPLERFRADPAAACFIAYFVARKNRRRLFSLSGRENPVDHAAQALLDACGPSADWEMIAFAHPVADVLARLGTAELGQLLGRWSALMADAAGMLQAAWAGGTDRETMIVRRGMDSSTWNAMAAAYNAARAGWINCLEAAGALPLLDAACPGKVMRLMAADLAWWHRASGGDVDPNTKVWAALPLPWEVLSGDAVCTSATVESACRAAGLDPAKSGWTGSRARGRVADFVATPELVHGVEIADPAWASLLRRARVFSGKRVKPELAAEAAHGIAGGVVTGDLPAKRPVE